MKKYTRKLIRLGAAVAMLASFSSYTYASVSLSGNTFSWPNDAWYVVQNTLTQEIVCEGGTGCTVPDGEYWITRHNADGGGSGVGRFQVGEVQSFTQQEFEDSIVVDGLSLTFNIPGWYQVQRTTDYSEVCGGFDGCTVPEAGEYKITNHGAGKMSAVLQLGEPTIVEPVHPVRSDIVVNGRVISWPDNGWYQVQRSDNFASVCQGGTECTVLPGEYIVINLTTGDRFPAIRVLSDSSPVINHDNYAAVIRQVFEVFSGQAFDQRLVEFPYIRNFGTQNPATCSNGGTHQQMRTPQRTGSVHYNVEASDCLYGFDFAGLGDTIDGTFFDANSPIGHRLAFSNFTTELSAGGEMVVDGGFATSVGGAGETIETLDLDYRFTQGGNSLIVENANTRLLRPFTLRTSTGLMEGSFSMISSASNNTRVDVTIEQQFEYNQQDVLAQGIDALSVQDEQTRNSMRFVRGVMRIISAADGSTITIDIDNGFLESFSVLLNNSQTTLSAAFPWSNWLGSLQGNLVPDFQSR